MKNNPFIRSCISPLLVFIALFGSMNFFASRPAAPVQQQFTAITVENAPQIIADIIRVIGLKPNFEVVEANVPNALATTYRGKRYIAYNPKFISQLSQAAGNKWAAVSVLAHEVGHHLNGHTLLNSGSQPMLELEADEFSGFVLQKMGASLEQAQVAMKIAASYKPSLTHPGQADRLTAIRKGYTNAGSAMNADMAKYNKPVAPRGETITPAKARPRSSDMAMLDSRYILASVSFNGDQSAQYYVTTRFNVVKVEAGTLQVLGKMLTTNSAEYPYILKGNKKGTFLVDKRGRIFTTNKELAGYLKT